MNSPMAKHITSPSQKETVSAKRSKYGSNVQQEQVCYCVMGSQPLVSFDTSLGRDVLPPVAILFTLWEVIINDSQETVAGDFSRVHI